MTYTARYYVTATLLVGAIIINGLVNYLQQQMYTAAAADRADLRKRVDDLTARAALLEGKK